MLSPLIRVPEHGRLRVGDTVDGVRFTQTHFEALVRLNDATGQRFFTIGHRQVKCTQYVGVVAIPGLTIEVLPKPAGEGDDASRWQQALIEMLRVVHGLDLHEGGQARLRLRRTSVLEHFLRLYVVEVRRLVHQGLVKRYRMQAGVSMSLKGRLDLPRHIRGSIVHRERFHVVRQVYDTDHLLHAILKQALGVVEQLTRDPVTLGMAQDLSWAFEHVSHQAITETTFRSLKPDRKTRAYAQVLQLARLLLLNYSPDVRQGREHILSLMFDMNRLYEQVVLALLRRTARRRGWPVEVSGRNYRKFWRGSGLNPDIILRVDSHIRCILDTKWKLPTNDRPADADLKQMYVYNRQYGAAESVLLYPGAYREVPTEAFVPDAHKGPGHGCSLRFVELFNEKGFLRTDDLARMLRELLPDVCVQEAVLSD